MKTPGVEKELLNLLQTVDSLACLNLNHTELKGAFITSEEFIQAIGMHSNLRKLSLRDNRLSEHACILLSGLCCMEKITLSLLNLGCNEIKYSDLLSAAERIQTYRREHFLLDRYALDTLDIAGNLVLLWDNCSREHHKEVFKAFAGIVRNLVGTSHEPVWIFGTNSKNLNVYAM